MLKLYISLGSAFSRVYALVRGGRNRLQEKNDTEEEVEAIKGNLKEEKRETTESEC